MEWIEHLNQAMDYIEKHLTEEISYDQAARLACCSTYHFQRMFVYMADVTLSEYIRRRRMTLAAWDLQCTDQKIIDIAMKYGYDSPTAFNRAFQSVHQVAPSIARKEGVLLKSYTPISFKITIKGDEEMQYKIVTKEAFRIVGFAKPLVQDVETNFQMVPGMWQEAAESGAVERLASMMDSEPMGILGVSACNESEQWKYFIAAASTKPAVEPFEEFIVPASTWAVFSGEGPMPGSIQELEKRIVTEWLPNSGYEYANAPDIELYLSPDPQNAKYEVWLPVAKKEN